MASEPPNDLTAEASVLGAILVVPKYLSAIVTETGLAPEHFYRIRHESIYRAILALHDRGGEIDAITVSAELRSRPSEREGSQLDEVGGAGVINELASTVPVPGNALHYAKIVIDAAEWRLRMQAAAIIRKGVEERDRDAIARAEELLRQDLVHHDADWDPDRLADRAAELMEGKGPRPIIEWPLNDLTRMTNGGLRRGQYVLLGGITSHGKSILLDQTLDGAVRAGLRARLYINEMTPDERLIRMLTRRSRVESSRLSGVDELTQADREAVVDELNRGLPYGITDCAGWSAEEIAHHVRLHKWDVVGVDMLHEIEYVDERDIARNSDVLQICAKLAKCVMIATCHLSEKRAGKSTREVPVLGDIKGSGSLKYDADVVAFVWMEQDDVTGEPLADGRIYVAKVRGGGRTGSVGVALNRRRLVFERRNDLTAAAAKADAEPSVPSVTVPSFDDDGDSTFL